MGGGGVRRGYGRGKSKGQTRFSKSSAPIVMYGKTRLQSLARVTTSRELPGRDSSFLFFCVLHEWQGVWLLPSATRRRRAGICLACKAFRKNQERGSVTVNVMEWKGVQEGVMSGGRYLRQVPHLK